MQSISISEIPKVFRNRPRRQTLFERTNRSMGIVKSPLYFPKTFCILLNRSAIATNGHSSCKKQAGVVMCCYGMFLGSSAIATNGKSSKQKQYSAMCCYGMFLERTGLNTYELVKFLVETEYCYAHVALPLFRRCNNWMGK